jgi:hypothetical protein
MNAVVVVKINHAHSKPIERYHFSESNKIGSTPKRVINNFIRFLK